MTNIFIFTSSDELTLVAEECEHSALYCIEPVARITLRALHAAQLFPSETRAQLFALARDVDFLFPKLPSAILFDEQSMQQPSAEAVTEQFEKEPERDNNTELSREPEVVIRLSSSNVSNLLPYVNE